MCLTDCQQHQHIILGIARVTQLTPFPRAANAQLSRLNNWTQHSDISKE